MKFFLPKEGQVNIYYKNTCVTASGESAKLIAMGLCTMFVLFGLAAIARVK